MLRRISVKNLVPEMDISSSKMEPVISKVELNRRQQEFTIIRQFDEEEIDLKKSFFVLIDANWIHKWRAFISAKEPGAPRPGPLRNIFLDTNGFLQAGLQPVRDFRGVSPTVFALYKELYGADDNSLICRREIDLYGTELTMKEVDDVMNPAYERAKEALHPKILTGRSGRVLTAMSLSPKHIKLD